MKIVQITDLHINAIDESCEVNVRNNFIKLIHELSTLSFDYLVVTGDLCLSKGDTKTYLWIKTKLDTLQKPYYIIPGNHDNNELISTVYDITLNNRSIYYYSILENRSIYFLDTSTEVLPPQQIEWFTQQLENDVDKSPIVFMHHPPIKTGVQYMDTHHALKNREETTKLLHQFTDKKFTIFCGHFHTQKEVVFNNGTLYITPSNFVNVNNEMDVLQIENHNTAYRIITSVENDVTSEVKYVL